MQILDSGERREFSSGAVRDISEGKGRMDLMPLDVIYRFCNFVNNSTTDEPLFSLSHLFHTFDKFLNERDEDVLFWLVQTFIFKFYSGSIESALLDLSIHYEQGAKKYVERNWERGIDAHCFVDSALRHGIKVLRGDDDEPHGRAFLWNVFGLVWTLQHKPEFDDLPKVKDTLNNRREII